MKITKGILSIVLLGSIVTIMILFVQTSKITHNKDKTPESSVQNHSNENSTLSEKIEYSVPTREISGDNEHITVNSWEITKDSSGQPILNVTFTFENKTADSVYMQQFANSRIRVGQFKGSEVGAMGLNVASVADIVVAPHSKERATLSAHSTFGVSFDMNDSSNNKFIFQVVSQPNTTLAEEPISGITLSFDKNGKNI